MALLQLCMEVVHPNNLLVFLSTVGICGLWSSIVALNKCSYCAANGLSSLVLGRQASFHSKDSQGTKVFACLICIVSFPFISFWHPRGSYALYVSLHSEV